MDFASKWQETLHDIWDENWDSDKKTRQSQSESCGYV